MTQVARGDGSPLYRIPVPLPSLGLQIRATPKDLAAALSDQLEALTVCGLGESWHAPLTEFTMAQVGSLQIASGRTTPLAIQFRPSEHLFVKLCFAGQVCFKDGTAHLGSLPGGIVAFPTAAGMLSGGFYSGISFRLDRSRLLRTARAMLGLDGVEPYNAPFLLPGPEGGAARHGRSLLFSLFRHLDGVFREDSYLPSQLELDDQIYRTFVHQSARAFRLGSGTEAGSDGQRWTPMLDDLVDYIRANSQQRLSLTDLEERSHYSARHLQHLFRQKFDCSPMQFVRRQRLTQAMQRLQASSRQDSVTRIARECGYRHLSNFTTDFRREFGINPSQVLRASPSGRLS